jgi:hypothetical protein
MERALYGPDGFFRRPGPGPAGHFRTSANASPLFAAAVGRLLTALGRGTRQSGPVRRRRRRCRSGVSCWSRWRRRPRRPEERLRRTAVEIADRPAGLDPDIDLDRRTPIGVTGLLIATEWLDNVPLDVAVGDPPRYLHVGGRHGVAVDSRRRKWLRAWWPTTTDAGARAEIGRTRDEAWAAAVSTWSAGWRWRWTTATSAARGRRSARSPVPRRPAGRSGAGRLLRRQRVRGDGRGGRGGRAVARAEPAWSASARRCGRSASTAGARR